MPNRLDFEIDVTDKSSAKSGKVAREIRKLSNDLELAQIRVANAAVKAGAAEEKFGKGSTQAQEAVARLTRAEIQAEGASAKLGVAQKKAAGELESAEKKIGKFRIAVSGASKAVGSFAAQAVVQDAVRRFGIFLSESVDAASNLGESLNAVDKVFGDSANTIKQWGRTSAASYAISQRAFYEMATPLGAGLKNAGLSMQDTAKWTIDLTKRAADMASVFHTDVSDALEAITAALRGESDPIERYGASITAAAVQTEALTATQKKSASELTNTELATARLNLIMRQTASTEGDFIDTSDSLANSQKKASVELENAKAQLGEGLLPIMADLTSKTATVVSQFAALPGPVQAATVGTIAFGAALLILVPRIKATKDALIEMGITSEVSKDRMAGAASAAGKLAAAFAAIQLAGQAFSSGSGAKGLDTTTKALKEMQTTGEDTSGTLKQLDHDLYKIGGAKWAEGAEKALESVLGTWGDSLASTEERLSSLDAALAQEVQSGHAADAAAQWDILVKKANEQDTSLDRLKERFPQYQNALDSVTTSNTAAGDASAKTAIEQQKQAAATEALTKALDANNNKLLQLSGGEIGYYASVDEATKAIKENGKTLDVTTEKGRANKSALDDQAKSALQYLSVMQEQDVPAAQFNAKLDEMYRRLYRTALAMGMSKAQAKAYANQILGIPHMASTTVRTPGLSNAISQVRTLRTDIARVDGRVVTIHYRSTGTVRVGSSGNYRTARAAGGYIPGPPSTTDTVPAMLSTGEFVVNAHSTARHRGLLEAINRNHYASGGFVAPKAGLVGGNITVIVNSQFGTRADIVPAVVEGLRKAIRNGSSGNVQQYLGTGAG